MSKRLSVGYVDLDNWLPLGAGEDPMSELLREERLQIMLTAEELKVVDDWRFAKRMPSRASAIRELLKRGLLAEGFLLAGDSAKSQDFGVLTAKADGV